MFRRDEEGELGMERGHDCMIRFEYLGPAIRVVYASAKNHLGSYLTIQLAGPCDPLPYFGLFHRPLFN